MIYNYDKLRGRIKEYFGSEGNFAKSINLSGVSLSSKLNNKTCFTQDEIMITIKRLNINSNEIKDIFFTEQVEKN